jgi:hypothetical protein
VSEESDLFGLGTAAIGFIGKANFKLVNLGDVSNFSPRELEDISIAANITRFRRPEDSAWDPRRGEKHRNDAYFVTTADISTNCRLWRLRFDDISKDPEKGGTVEILLTGSEGHRMLDNVTIDRFGRIVMDEDRAIIHAFRKFGFTKLEPANSFKSQSTIRSSSTRRS